MKKTRELSVTCGSKLRRCQGWLEPDWGEGECGPRLQLSLLLWVVAWLSRRTGSVRTHTIQGWWRQIGALPWSGSRGKVLCWTCKFCRSLWLSNGSCFTAVSAPIPQGCLTAMALVSVHWWFFWVDNYCESGTVAMFQLRGSFYLVGTLRWEITFFFHPLFLPVRRDLWILNILSGSSPFLLPLMSALSLSQMWLVWDSWECAPPRAVPPPGASHQHSLPSLGVSHFSKEPCFF